MRYKKKVLLLSGLFLLLPLCLFARKTGGYSRRAFNNGKTDNYHFLYVSMSGGYTSISENVDSLTSKGGAGCAFGLGYEFRRSGFWLSVGGQFQFHNSRSVLDDYVYEHEGLDTQRDRKPVTLVYTFHEKSEQKLRFVDVPLMMGYYYNGFYAGLGGKVSFSLSSYVSNSGSFDLKYRYSQYVDMPTPLVLDDNSLSGKQELRMKVGASLIGEIGYDVLAMRRSRGSTCHLLKVGFYFEYGLNSFISGNADLQKISFPNIDAQGQTIATQPKLNPFYSLKHKSGFRAAPYFVGVKLTYMIGGSRTGNTGTWHRGCQCYE